MQRWSYLSIKCFGLLIFVYSPWLPSTSSSFANNAEWTCSYSLADLSVIYYSTVLLSHASWNGSKLYIMYWYNIAFMHQISRIQILYTGRVFTFRLDNCWLCQFLFALFIMGCRYSSFIFTVQSVPAGCQSSTETWIALCQRHTSDYDPVFRIQPWIIHWYFIHMNNSSIFLNFNNSSMFCLQYLASKTLQALEDEGKVIFNGAQNHLVLLPLCALLTKRKQKTIVLHCA